MIDFFYPPQPTRVWPDSPLLKQLGNNQRWIAEIKYNGWRLILIKQAGTISIYNRQGRLIDIDKKPFLPHFVDLPDGTVFDGELVHFRTTDLKNIMIFWDCMFWDGTDLRDHKHSARRPHLDVFATAPSILKTKDTAQVFKTQLFFKDFKKLYDKIERRDNDLEEGIVIKNLDEKYRWSPRRKVVIPKWIKCKKTSAADRVDL